MFCLVFLNAKTKLMKIGVHCTEKIGTWGRFHENSFNGEYITMWSQFNDYFLFDLMFWVVFANNDIKFIETSLQWL